MPFRIGPKGIFFAESSSAPYWTYAGVFFTPTLSAFHKRSPSRRKGNAGVTSSGTPCTPAGGSYLLSSRRGSGVGLVWWTSEARDSVRRRLSVSRKFRCMAILLNIFICNNKWLDIGWEKYFPTMQHPISCTPITLMHSWLDYWMVYNKGGGVFWWNSTICTR